MSRSRRHGTTLVELAIAIAIAGTILQLAMQGYSSWRRAAAIQRTAGSIGTLLVRARTEARSSGMPYRLRHLTRENVLQGHRCELLSGGRSSDWVLDREVQLDARSDLAMPEGRDLWIVDAGGAVLDSDGRIAENQTLQLRVGPDGSRREISLTPDGDLRVEAQ